MRKGVFLYLVTHVPFNKVFTKAVKVDFDF